MGFLDAVVVCGIQHKVEKSPDDNSKAPFLDLKSNGLIGTRELIVLKQREIMDFDGWHVQRVILCVKKLNEFSHLCTVARQNGSHEPIRLT